MGERGLKSTRKGVGWTGSSGRGAREPGRVARVGPGRAVGAATSHVGVARRRRGPARQQAERARRAKR